MNYQINQKLSDENSGNYLVKVVKIGDKNKSKFCSFEYYVDVTIQITDLNNPTKKCGVIVPGFGPKPIELNIDRKLHNTIFFDFQDFNEELYTKLLRTQTSINQEGYYKKVV